MGRLVAALLAALCGAAPARADPFPPITSRDFTLDLYVGPVLGSVRIVGMGGAAVATAEGAAGIPSTPAAPAIRPATSNDRWDWDWNVDWHNPELGSDFDGNGQLASGVDRTRILTGGLVGRYGAWGLGVNVGIERYLVADAASGENRADAQSLVARAALSRTFAREVTAGLGVRTGEFSAGEVSGEVRTRTLFVITGSSLEAGAVWHPHERAWRAALTGALPVSGEHVTTSDCDPADCFGFILPERVVAPWQIAAGAAVRVGDTPWNRSIPARWRDERALLLAADVVVTGAVKNGYGLEAFVDQQLQPSGRHVTVSVRGGAEYEWKPGWLRVRAGSYWEPARFQGAGGRVHGTAGLDVRFWSFCFWGRAYRARLSLTSDIARHYGNVGLSIGLWH